MPNLNAFSCLNFTIIEYILCIDKNCFYINKNFLSAHHIYCIFKSINEVTTLDDERDISDFSDSSNDDFQKFLPTNIGRYS